MSVLLILGRFYRKRTKNSKIWVISKVHAVTKGSFAAAWLRRINRTVSGSLQRRASPRRSHCSHHGKLLCFVLFRYSVIPLFQGHVYRTNEDLIRAMVG